MAKDEIDFMITEYDRISTAFFGLQNQVNDWFKSYLTIIGFPLTVFIAILKLMPDENEVSISSLPNLVSGLLIIVALLGLFITVSTVSMRMEMIMYARTINLVRRFFAEKNDNLHKYLVLPKTDTKPGFYEKKDTLNWQIIIMAIINSILITVSLLNITNLNFLICLIIGLAFFSIHWLFYIALAKRREKNWNVNQPEDIGISNY